MKNIDEIRKDYVLGIPVSEDEYNKAKASMPPADFQENYTIINKRYVKIDMLTDDELQVTILENKLGSIENNTNTLKGIGIFFVVLTAISLVLSIASTVALSSIF